ncbi:MAG: acyl carrier protein [Bacilli bacterium]|nr:acyl carrier protein [Bacilli bacterium]
MREEEILERLRKAGCEALGDDKMKQAKLGDRLVDDLGLDSISMLYLAMAIENEFAGIDFENSELSSMKTVKDVVTYIKKKAA